MSAHVYVYYRVAAGARDNAIAAVTRLLPLVTAATGIAGRVMRREEDPETWMEVYEAVGDTTVFCEALARLSATAGLDAVLGGADARHVERFVDAAPCA